MALTRPSVRRYGPAMAKAPAVEVEVGGRSVRISNPDRVYFPAHRAHEARPGRVLPRGRARHRERPPRATVHAAPVPEGHRRRQGPPEAGAGRRPAVAGDRAGALPPLRPARRRAVRDRAGPGDLGRADVHRRVPPVELATGRRRAAGRVAHRPRPDARLPAGPGPPRRPRRPRGARRAGCRRLAQDVRRATACTSTSASRPTTASPSVRRAALAFAREVERRAPDGRHDHLVAQGPGPLRAVRRLQPERPRPHHGRRLLGPGPARRHRVDPDHVGRGRRRRAGRLHGAHRAPALRRARRPPRRHRPARLGRSTRSSTGPTATSATAPSTRRRTRRRRARPCPRPGPGARADVAGGTGRA